MGLLGDVEQACGARPGLSGERQRVGATEEVGELVDVGVAGERALERRHRGVGVGEEVERRGGEREGHASPIGSLEALGDGAGGPTEAHLEPVAFLRAVAR